MLSFYVVFSNAKGYNVTSFTRFSMKTRPNSELARRLREQREYLGFTQLEVAGVLGISRSALSLVESGKRRVRVSELKQLANLYRCSIRYLLGDEEPAAALSEATQELLSKVGKLSAKDQAEVLRFAQFLAYRAS